MCRAFLLCILVQAPAQAEVVLDQAFDEYGGYAQAAGQAQAFTVGRSGWLVKAEIFARPASFTASASAGIELSVVETVNQIPRALPEDILAVSSAIVTAPDQRPWVFTWVPFEFDPVPVVAGEQLGLALRSTTSTDYQWSFNPSDDGYLGGSGYQSFSVDLTDRPRVLGDFLFRTYVMVPEPASCYVLVVGMACLLSIHRVSKSGVQGSR